MADKRIQQYPLKATIGATDLILIADVSDVDVNGFFKYKKVEAETLATSLSRATVLTRAELIAFVNASALIQGGAYVISNAVSGTLSLMVFAVEDNVISELAFDTTNGEIYTYDYANDTAVNGFSTGILDLTPQTAPAYLRGRVWYDSASETISYYDDISGTSTQIAQENHVRARNSTGSQINDGQVVYISGATGSNPNITLAQANTASTSRVIGMVTHNIANNTIGKVTTFGIVNDIDTSAFTDGALLYLSPSVAGGLTTTRPSAPNYAVLVGVCLRAHPTQGRILVNPDQRGLGFGIANQLLGMNAGATEQEYKTMDFVQPEWYGAVGDGVTDDTQAFKDAIASGINNLKLTSGKTYIISRQLTIPSNFTIDGNFAKIKRADITLTTLASVASVGNTTLTVADASNFEIGDEIVLTNSTGANGGVRFSQLSNWANGKTTITNINNNTITIADAVVATQGGITSFAIGSNVFKVNNLLASSGDAENITIKNITFDGNSSSNDKNFFWVLQVSISAVGYYTNIENCRFINSPCENIFVGGPAYINNCSYQDLNGSFVHIAVSGASDKEDVKVTNCRGENSNIKDSLLETDHSEGIITYSQGPYNTWIVGNHFVNSNGEYFIAPIEPTGVRSTTGDKLYCANNKIENADGVILSNMVYGANGNQLALIDNQFINCRNFTLLPDESPNIFRDGADAQVDVAITGNLFINTQFLIQSVANLRFTNNEIKYTSDYVATTAVSFNNSALLLRVFNAIIDNNHFELPITPVTNLSRAITVLPVAESAAGGYINNSVPAATPYYYSQNILINNNLINNATIGIITIPTFSSTYTTVAQWINLLIQGNVITMNSVANATGIVAGAGVACIGNTITGFGGANSQGIYVFGASSSNFGSLNGAVVLSNTIYGTMTASIFYGMSVNNGYNNIIKQNVVTSGVTNGGAGSGNVVSDNTTLPVPNQAIPRQPLFAFPERY